MVEEVSGEIISIGDELITGKVENTTAHYAARRLLEHGFTLSHITSVGDDAEAIASAIHLGLSRSAFIIVSGGLGPTDDDITNEAVAQGLGVGLRFQPSIFQRVMERAGAIYTEEMGRKMASLPSGAQELNPSGNAAGYLLEHHRIPIFFLPGVPYQMEEHLDRRVIPWLEARFPHRPRWRSATLTTFGVAETRLNGLLAGLSDSNVKIGYYPRFPEVHVVVTVKGEDDDSVGRRLKKVVAEAAELIGEDLISTEGESIEEVLGRRLAAQGRLMAVAESCTGGLVASRITSVPGSSKWFDRGVVTYSNSAKEEILGVSSRTLSTHGAVSRATALEMVRGLLDRSDAHFGLAITGIAGPTGGTAEKPVGTVFIALATPQETMVHRFLFTGDRHHIQALTATTALDWLRRVVQYGSDLPGHPFAG